MRTPALRAPRAVRPLRCSPRHAPSRPLCCLPYSDKLHKSARQKNKPQDRKPSLLPRFKDGTADSGLAAFGEKRYTDSFGSQIEDPLAKELYNIMAERYARGRMTGNQRGHSLLNRTLCRFYRHIIRSNLSGGSLIILLTRATQRLLRFCVSNGIFPVYL